MFVHNRNFRRKNIKKEVNMIWIRASKARSTIILLTFYLLSLFKQNIQKWILSYKLYYNLLA